MQFIKITLVLVSLFFSLSVQAQQTLRIHGSNTIGAKLMPALVTQWLQGNGFVIRSDSFSQVGERLIRAARGGERIDVEIHAHGSSTGFKSLQASSADLAMASRKVRAMEVESLAHLGDVSDTSKESVVAVDGIAVIVHPSNPVSSLSMPQLKAVFSGVIRNWASFGGENRPIQVYARNKRSGTYDTFKSLVLEGKAGLLLNVKRHESNDALSDDVSQDKGGIGFTGLPSIRDSKVLAIADGKNPAILPSELSVATEDYPLSRRLYVYQPHVDNILATDLTQFIKSAQGQDVVAQFGFISQNINSYSIELGRRYPENYKKLLQGASRLSLNLRFKPGAYELDNKSLQDIDRLADFVNGRKIEELILAGFSDGAEATPWRRHLLSTERGDFVADALIKKGIVPNAVRGFGSQVQVASNTTEKGRDKNRRVEVWVK